jgi:hypothetical protein
MHLFELAAAACFTLFPSPAEQMQFVDGVFRLADRYHGAVIVLDDPATPPNQGKQRKRDWREQWRKANNKGKPNIRRIRAHARRNRRMKEPCPTLCHTSSPA